MNDYVTIGNWNTVYIWYAFCFVFTSRQRGSVPVVEILCLENEGTERCPPVEKFPAHRVPPAHQAPEKNIITQVKD